MHIPPAYSQLIASISSIPNLEQLTINFANFMEPQDSHFPEHLAQILPNIILLKDLEVNFGNIAPDHLNLVLKNISFCGQLKSLVLDFANLETIAEESIFELLLKLYLNYKN